MESIFKANEETKTLVIPLDDRNMNQLCQIVENLDLISRGVYFLANNSKYAFKIYNDADEDAGDYIEESGLPQEEIDEYYRRKEYKHNNRFAYRLYSQPLQRWGDGRNIVFSGLSDIPKRFWSESFIGTDVKGVDGYPMTYSDIINTSMEQARYAFVLGRLALLNELGFLDTYHMQYNLFSSLSTSLSVFSENINVTDTQFNYTLFNPAKYSKLTEKLGKYMTDDSFILNINDDFYTLNTYVVALLRLLKEVNNAFKHRVHNNFILLDKKYANYIENYVSQLLTDDEVELASKFEKTYDKINYSCSECGEVIDKDLAFHLDMDGIGLMGVIISNNDIFTNKNNKGLKKNLELLKKTINYIENHKKEFYSDLDLINPEQYHSVKYTKEVIENNLIYLGSNVTNGDISDEKDSKDVKYIIDFVVLIKLLHSYYVKTHKEYNVNISDC